MDIENFNKNELTIRAKERGEEKFLIAFNKKRITESDFIKAGKKSAETGLPYIILSLGEPLKKLKEFIKALERLSYISKIE